MTTFEEMRQELGGFATFEEYAAWTDFYEPGRTAPEPGATIDEHEASAQRQWRGQGH